MTSVSFTLDPNSKIKLYFQLYNNFARMIACGELEAGTKLPSVRNLAEELHISRNTVTKAYEILNTNNYIESFEKRGFFVKDVGFKTDEELAQLGFTRSEEAIPTVDSIIKHHKVPEIPEQDPIKEKLLEAMPELSSTKTSVDAPFSMEKAFAQSYSNILTNCIKQLEKSSDAFGEKDFRSAISSYLYRFRKIDASYRNLFVSFNLKMLIGKIISLSGISKPSYKDSLNVRGLLQKAEKITDQKAMPLITPSVAIPEDAPIEIENYFLQSKLQVKRIPYDDDGPTMDAIITSGVTIVFITPFYSPLASVESLTKRMSELLNWSSQFNYRYIIEYDTATQQNEKSFKALDKKDKVIYINCLSDLLCKGIEASWCILPELLKKEYEEKYNDADCPLSTLDQLALADFINGGNLEKYLCTLETLQNNE